MGCQLTDLSDVKFKIKVLVYNVQGWEEEKLEIFTKYWTDLLPWEGNAVDSSKVFETDTSSGAAAWFVEGIFLCFWICYGDFLQELQQQHSYKS